MARCYNCGCDISDDDKTKLCDECKTVILPFIKFMDASTSSAVRRLVSNEENLRNAGVTDSGMDYLLKICDIHDRKKAEESAEGQEDEDLFDQEIEGNDDMVFDIEGTPVETAQPEQPEQPVQYSDVEIPLDKPLNIIRKPYAQFIVAAEIVLGIVAAALLVWFFVDYLAWSKVDFSAVAGCIACAAGVYLADSLRKMIYDIEELKKHFR